MPILKPVYLYKTFSLKLIYFYFRITEPDTTQDEAYTPINIEGIEENLLDIKKMLYEKYVVEREPRPFINYDGISAAITSLCRQMNDTIKMIESLILHGEAMVIKLTEKNAKKDVEGKVKMQTEKNIHYQHIISKIKDYQQKMQLLQFFMMAMDSMASRGLSMDNNSIRRLWAMTDLEE